MLVFRTYSFFYFLFRFSRIAFLVLVRLNFRALASRFTKLSSSEIDEFWKKFGGNDNSLEKAIEAGKNKRPIGGTGTKKINGYLYGPGEGGGEGGGDTAAKVAEFAKYLGPAGMLIEAIVKLFKKKNIPDPEDLEGAIPDATGETETGKESVSFKPSPILIGGVLGAGVLIYLLTKKKK